MSKQITCTLLAVVCLLLAGCAAVAPGASTAAPPVSTERSLIVARAQAAPGNFSDLDPSAACQGEYQILLNVYETLTLYNPPGSAKPIRPALATDWQVSDDGLTWTFHLRQGRDLSRRRAA